MSDKPRIDARTTEIQDWIYIDPKSCPCCGGEGQSVFDISTENHNHARFYIRCVNCGIRTPACLGYEEAISIWNHRINDMGSDIIAAAKIDELIKKLDQATAEMQFLQNSVSRIAGMV